MVTAGVAAALGERVTLDLAWRYTDLGAVQTCQWRSKKGPPWRCKKGPLGGCGLVP